MKKLSLYALTLAALTAGAAMPSHWDGGRVPPIHRLGVKDLSGDTVVPDDPKALPVSTRQTCSLCHDIDTIASGWHFNAAETNACPGRLGEPWFMIDPATGTQLPLSYRGWKGTYKPADIGMDDFDFTWRFGRNLPGGGVASPDEEGLMAGRWNVSGPLEVNCFACHDQSGLYDHSEYVKQITRQNFSWAMSAAMGWCEVDGMSERMPDYWGMMWGRNPDDSIFRVPATITYDPKQFDSKSRLVFKVGRPQNDSCLNCHGVSQSGAPAMSIDGDVHLRAGMSCVDCHRNGEDHKISRGYAHKGIDAAAMSLTCAGCHVADKGKAGRHGAPAPKHIGFPTVHFEKLACTVCHSGVTRGGELGTVQTCRANRMGVYGRAKWLTDAPYIQEPVFVRDAKSGKIEPRRMVWPAFWATRSEDGVKPLDTGKVAEIAGDTLTAMKDVGAVLVMLDSDPNIGMNGKRPVLAVDGKLFRANVDGIPVPFGEAEGANGYFYIADPDRKVAEADEPETPAETDKQTELINAAIAKAFPVEVVTLDSIIPDVYDPEMDVDAAAAKDFEKVKGDVDTITQAMIAAEKEDLDQLSAEDQKARKEEIATGVKDAVSSALSQRLSDRNEALAKQVNDLLTTIEASDAFTAAGTLVTSGKAGALITSGKIFYIEPGSTGTVVHAAAPAGAAAKDFGIYLLAEKTFASMINTTAAKQVAQLAGTTAALTEEMLTATLKKLAAAGIEKPVYVGHGQVWELQGEQLTVQVEKCAEPVSWAFGHDVRPARLARGAKPVKCADCHTANSKFFFQKVTSTGPLLTAKTLSTAQNVFMGTDKFYHQSFGAMFLVRPVFKIFLWVVFAILSLVAIAFTAAAVPVFLKAGAVPYGTKSEKLISTINRLSGCAMGIATLYLACSGCIGFFTGAMKGWMLVGHQLAGGLFCAALLALIWFRGANRIATKRAFWWMLAMVLAVIVVFTAVAPMMTVFGDGWQQTLLWAHRCTTGCFILVGLWMLMTSGRKE